MSRALKDSEITYPPEKSGGFFFELNPEKKNGIL